MIAPPTPTNITIADISNNLLVVSSRDNSNLEALTSQDDYVRGMELVNLDRLQTVAAPIATGGFNYNFTLQNLVALQSIQMPLLEHIDLMRWENLPRLSQFIHSPDLFSPGIMYMSNVGFSSLDDIFNISCPGGLFIEGIPNVNHLTLGGSRSGTIEVHGNGNLSVSISCPLGRRLRYGIVTLTEISKLSLSGVSALEFSDENATVYSINEVTVRQSKLTYLKLPPMAFGLSKLVLEDNPGLAHLVISRVEFGMITNFHLTGCPSLSKIEGWEWNSFGYEELVFDGPFSNDFL